MTDTKKFKRVVTCQGGIQLVAALAALQSREDDQPRSDVEYEDFLLSINPPFPRLRRKQAGLFFSDWALKKWFGARQNPATSKKANSFYH